MKVTSGAQRYLSRGPHYKDLLQRNFFPSSESASHRIRHISDSVPLYRVGGNSKTLKTLNP